MLYRLYLLLALGFLYLQIFVQYCVFMSFRYITGLHLPSREESSWSAAKAMSSLEEHRGLFHKARNKNNELDMFSHQNIVGFFF